MRLVSDIHHKISSWLANNYRDVILPAFQTSEMVRKFTRDMTSDAVPDISEDHDDMIQRRPGAKRRTRSLTSRAMLAQARYKLKMLLKYKMARVGERVIDCDEQYTSETCSNCGEIKHDLGGNSTYTYSACHDMLD